MTEARPAMCCEGWFYKTTLSLTALACLASVNKDIGFSWQFSLVHLPYSHLLPWKIAALSHLPVIHSQSPRVSLRVS